MQTQKTTIKQAGRIAKMMTLIGCIFMLSAAVTHAATFHVTTKNDNGDNVNPTPGSLREAIIDANVNAGADTIDFQLPGAGVQTISPPTPLPVILDSVTIDGYTQPGASANTLAVGNNAVLLIELDGTNVVADHFAKIGLEIQSRDVTIRGLVINRFEYRGISIPTSDSGGEIIEGCFIGTDPTGNVARPNGFGIYTLQASIANLIGGTTPAARNVISGNGDPNAQVGNGIEINDSNSGNPIAATVIQGNYIGVNAAGTSALGNLDVGILVSSAMQTTIGGTTAAAGNVVSGNNYGVYLNEANQTLVQGNYIGTNAGGTAKVGNQSDGIFVYNSSNCTIGGAIPGTRNIISGNDQGVGINLTGDASTGNLIHGNYIGTDVTGNVAIGNSVGILFGRNNQSPFNNKIGGAAPGEGNLISGNLHIAIYLDGPNSANVVQGNYIGTKAAGTGALPNGNQGDQSTGSIHIATSAGVNLIGGTTAGARNIISGNNSSGIYLHQSSNQQIQGNYIGLDVNGAALGNSRFGIYVIGSKDNTIGGTSAGTGNVIAFNTFTGVTIIGTDDTGNAILGNSIYSNDPLHLDLGLGIDLGGNNGVTQNDASDTDPGSNNLQNYPILTAATSSNGSTSITATLNSEVNKQYRIEFYANAECDPSGNGEGQIFLGATNAMTVGNDANINATLPANVPAGYFITATATDPAGNTSEFSPCRLLGGAGAQGTLQFSGAGSYTVNEDAGTVLITVMRIGGSTGAVSVQYSTVANGGDATAGSDFTMTSGTLNWADGDSSSKTFSIAIANDMLDEFDEFFQVSLSNPTGGAVLNNQIINSVTITDDDAPPTISIQDASVTENNSGTKPVNFNVTLSAASGKPIQLTYSTIAGGTATSGVDYQPVSNNTITFNAGQIAKTATVNIIGDTIQEPNETFSVQLSNPTNATLDKAQGTGTILNDDVAPPPAALQFTQASYMVGESAGSITITVERTGDISAAASVYYTTMDASAQQRSDFNIALGKLSFAAGETSKTFPVFITDDAYVEGQESFSLSLSNPSGAVLGAQPMSVVTINDNDSQVTANNPIDSPDFFLRQHYVDFLNREPEPSGLAGWKAILNNCVPGDTSCDPVQVSSAFFRSPEFYDRGYFVYRFYEIALGRKPNYLEFMPGLTKVTGFLTPQELEAAKVEFISEFMATQEYKQKYDQILDAGTYVDTLAQTAGVVLSNRNALILALQTNQKTRAQVLREVVESTEVGAKFYNKAFVVMQYFGYLRRDPDALYLNWIDTLNQTGDYRVMVNGFINSTEYRARFNQ